MYPAPALSPTRLRDNRYLTRVAAPLLTGSALVDLLVNTVAANRSADRLARYRNGTLPASDLQRSFRFRYTLHGSFAFAGFVAIAATVLVVVTMFRMASNNRAFGRPGMRWALGWAVAGWLIPFANVVLPYLQLRELWRGSDPEIEPGASDWSRRPTPAAWRVALWLSVLGGAVSLVVTVWSAAAVLNHVGGSGDEMRVASAQVSADLRPLQAIALGLDVLAFAIVALLLLQVANRQHALAQRYATRSATRQWIPPADAPTAPYPVPTPPGWQPDPSHRFELRWWDGRSWTAHVSTAGETANDRPSPDPLTDPPRTSW